MKIHSLFKNKTLQPGRLGTVLGGLMLLAISAVTLKAEVLPPAALPYGYSYEEWSAKWWRWNLGLSTNHTELVGQPDIATDPAARVRFLAGAASTVTETRKITIPAETPLFFTILSVWGDNTGCPAFTTFTPDELASQIADQWTAVTKTTCTVDGVSVAGLGDPATSTYHVLSPTFSYVTANRGSVLDEPCVSGDTTIYPAVANGIYVMLSPLAPGKHTIHYVGVVGLATAPFIKEDITYDITVTRECY
jgi:hypothetical protein